MNLQQLTVRRGACPVVEDVTLAVECGEFVGLIGPNGAGKTTLLRAALGVLPFEGRSSLAAMPVAARARAVAFLPQAREVAWPVTVETLVGLGRVPHLSGRMAPADQAAVTRALGRMGLEGFRARNALGLSGGELARVLIARVLAQDTPLVLADEPVAGLDPAAQLRTMAVFAALAAEGQGVVASVHDLGLAARFCSRLVMLSRGRVVADGAPRDVLTPDLLGQVFGVRAHLAEVDGAPLVVPLEVVGDV